MDLSTINSKIGANLKTLRKEAGLSQQQVAALFDLTYQQIQKYESGRSRVPAAMLVKLQALYEVPYGQFFAGAGSSSTQPYGELGSGDFDETTFQICRQLGSVADPALKKKIGDVVAILST